MGQHNDVRVVLPCGDGRVGLRRWSKVPVLRGVGSNPTRHIFFAFHEMRISNYFRQIRSLTPILPLTKTEPSIPIYCQPKSTQFSSFNESKAYCLILSLFYDRMEDKSGSRGAEESSQIGRCLFALIGFGLCFGGAVRLKGLLIRGLFNEPAFCLQLRSELCYKTSSTSQKSMDFHSVAILTLKDSAS